MRTNGSIGKNSVAVSKECHIAVSGGCGLLQWPELDRCFSKDAGFSLVRCPEPEAFVRCCVRLAPCVAIAGHSAIRAMDADKFATLTSVSGVKLLVCMESEEIEEAKQLLEMGCMGLLYGPPGVVSLRKAVSAVSSGEVWASRRVVSELIQGAAASRNHKQLTPRETEILKLVGLGYKNSDIADRLFISRETVRWHMRTLYTKIRLHDRRSAAMYAVKFYNLPSLKRSKHAYSPASACDSTLSE